MVNDLVVPRRKLRGVLFILVLHVGCNRRSHRQWQQHGGLSAWYCGRPCVWLREQWRAAAGYAKWEVTPPYKEEMRKTWFHMQPNSLKFASLLDNILYILPDELDNTVQVASACQIHTVCQTQLKIWWRHGRHLIDQRLQKLTGMMGWVIVRRWS
jgi:hypothetical protein